MYEILYENIAISSDIRTIRLDHCNKYMVAPVGLEPTWVASMDFESIVSTIPPRSHITCVLD